jgi:hypothetical protein
MGKDDTFKLNDMEVKLIFREDPDIGQSAEVYVDNQKSGISVFRITPFDYEFGNQEKYSSSGETDYGYTIAKNKKHLEELKEEHSYWHAMTGDYSRESKDPFIAVAKMILFTY